MDGDVKEKWMRIVHTSKSSPWILTGCFCSLLLVIISRDVNKDTRRSSQKEEERGSGKRTKCDLRREEEEGEEEEEYEEEEEEEACAVTNWMNERRKRNTIGARSMD